MSIYFDFIDKAKLDEKAASGQFPFSKYLFWDATLENIDVEKNRVYIIERVLNRGKLDDFYLLIKFYSVEVIVKSIRAGVVLGPKTANFFINYYKIPRSEIKISNFYY